MADFIGILLLCGLIALAFHLESRRMARQPKTVFTRPYTWGYYVGLHGLVIGVCLGMFFLVVGGTTTGKSAGEYLLGGILVLAGWAVPGWFVLRRRRWAWIVSTVTSLNIVWWVVNWIYGKNRWQEFRTEEVLQRDAMPANDKP